MLRAISSNLRPGHWSFEVETLAVLDMAGLLFSLGIRFFLAFGLLVRTSPSSTPVQCSEEFTCG